jgi:hypothetical protein
MNIGMRSLRHWFSSHEYCTAVAILLFLPASAWAASIMDVSSLVNMVGMITVEFIGIVIVKDILISRSFKGWFGEFQVSGMRVVSVFRHGKNAEVLPNRGTGDR